MQVGAVVIAYIILSLILVVLFVCLIDDYVRNTLWSYFGGWIVSLCCAAGVKMAGTSLVFTYWQQNSAGEVRNIQSYSACFLVYLCFNALYGTLAAIYRLIYFWIFSIAASMRLDASLLPLPLRSLDAGYSSYNAYLLYLVSTLVESSTLHVYI